MPTKFYRFLFPLVLLAAFVFPAAKPVFASAATTSGAECVVEISSRRFLQSHNGSTCMPMASTTKILTAITIIDDCDLDETVTVPKAAEGVEGSSVYLRAGDTLTVRDLLYGLMLRSGNDCAETLALHHSGSIAAFAARMNAKALALGAVNSHFVNPHGLPNDEHYTTAHDLALISAYAMENGTFREIVSCKYYEPKNWQNKNKMLYRYDGAIGVKTGFTMRAGRCLVTAAERDGMTLVCVVLNSPQMYERTAELLDHAYSEYHMKRLCSKGNLAESVRIKEDFDYPLTRAEENKIMISLETVSTLPTTDGEFAGVLKIFLENHLLFSQNVYMIIK